MFRRSISSASPEPGGAALLPLLLAVLLIPTAATGQERLDADAGLGDGGALEDEAEGDLEGPAPAPEIEATGPEPGKDSRGKVLVLPTRTDADGSDDAATFDVLMAAALQEIGFEVVEPEAIDDEIKRGIPTLDEATDLYLDLKLEEALAAARAVRDEEVARHGDLLDWEEITEAELFMVKVLLDLGRVNEALDTAVEILVRHPALRLDPVTYSPAMQALWLAAIERGMARQPTEPEDQELSGLGEAVGVNWVTAAVRKKNLDDTTWLIIKLVPAGKAERASRHPVALGPRGWWARDVRLALEERFPPPPDPVPEIPPVEPPPGGGEDEVAPWYKTWWFWTIVGAVVVGGTAGGLSGYYANKDENPQVTMDPGWE